MTAVAGDTVSEMSAISARAGAIGWKEVVAPIGMDAADMPPAGFGATGCVGWSVGVGAGLSAGSGTTDWLGASTDDGLSTGSVAAGASGDGAAEGLSTGSVTAGASGDGDADGLSEGFGVDGFVGASGVLVGVSRGSGCEGAAASDVSVALGSSAYATGPTAVSPKVAAIAQTARIAIIFFLSITSSVRCGIRFPHRGDPTGCQYVALQVRKCDEEVDSDD